MPKVAERDSSLVVALTQARSIDRRLLIASLVAGAALLGVVAWWTRRSFLLPYPLDLGLAYQAGQAAWATGHPEQLASWDGTPFLVTTMAVVGRLMSLRTASDLLNVLNTSIVVVTVSIALYRLRRAVTVKWWWVLAIALLTFGPMLSSAWWRQFNIVSLGLALAGFELLRRRRTGLAAALFGLSVAIKPVVWLLIIVLTIRRSTRRAGAAAIAWAVGLNVMAQALIAIRLGKVGLLNPYLPLHNFAHKSGSSSVYSCDPENFAPGALLCRLAGHSHWTLQHLVVWALVGLLGLWTIDALRGYSARSWEVFAFTCPLSVMLSPLAWSHYQILLAPLFVLLVVRCINEGAYPSIWVGIGSAFLLASLMWRPYGTLIGAVHGLFSPKSSPQYAVSWVEPIAQFAQYILLVTGILWYFQRGSRGHSRALTRVVSNAETESGIRIHHT